METEVVLSKYNSLINRSFLSLQQIRFKNLDIQFFHNHPILLLNISVVFESITINSPLDGTQKRQLADKLIDIKSLFCFLHTAWDRFYLGSFVIVGDGELEKANERQLSALQLTHYKVYLVAIRKVRDKRRKMQVVCV
jgi:hypothetical protein